MRQSHCLHNQTRFYPLALVFISSLLNTILLFLSPSEALSMIGKIPDSARFVTNKMCPYGRLIFSYIPSLFQGFEMIIAHNHAQTCP